MKHLVQLRIHFGDKNLPMHVMEFLGLYHVYTDVGT